MSPDQRAQFLDVLRRHLWHVLDLSASTEIIDDALGLAFDALLAFRFPCPECEGLGELPREPRAAVDCPSCGGSGVVDSPRLALVAKPEGVFETCIAGDDYPALRVRADLWELVVPDQEDTKP